MAQALVTTGKAIGIGVGSLSVIVYLALWGGQRQVLLQSSNQRSHIRPVSQQAREQTSQIHTTSTASITKIYTFPHLTARNYMPSSCCRRIQGTKRPCSSVMRMLGIWAIGSRSLPNSTASTDAMSLFTRIGGSAIAIMLIVGMASRLGHRRNAA
jgi:hypothetical protein